ncbi:thiamine pyrophosphate-binding protein [Bordetella sp. BOR01]|uniref:thiamine pyrophosphate-binding protein n=1 Tax=Bordetella sp. BOR01 TaxID=2854779 RepID=UPI001C471868|nr:thiamine pyrophosphate-dependent enzyme [Bordetella sp. BOR01]MBV7486163.1 hypothetical protein [Bordetella sp. BOR01]
MKDEAAEVIPVYEALARDLKAMQVEVVFALMAEDTALLAVTLDAMGIQLCGARHENNAVAMAEGYAAASGRLAVALIGRGPATANGLHASVYASRTGSGVLLICGAAAARPRLNGLGPDTKALQSVQVLTAAGVAAFCPSNAGAARHALAEACEVARRGTLAALLLPLDVQQESIAYAPPPPPVSAPIAEPAMGRPAAIAAAAALLAQARRPLIVAGKGAWKAGARAALEQLADKLGAGLCTTLKAKDLFRGHPFNAGIVGSFSLSAGRRLIDQADCVLAFGAGLNQRTTSVGTSIPAGVPLVQVDTARRSIGQNWHADVAIVGDAAVVAQQLLQAMPDRPAADKPLHGAEQRQALAAFRPEQDFTAAHTAHTVDPRSLAIALDQLLPEDRNLVFDAGNFLGALPYFGVGGPHALKNTSEFGSIGLGLGTALGWRRGTAAACTVLIIGDGGLLMALGELETMVREDLPLVIVVMNDCAYGAETHFLKNRNMPVAKSLFADVDFAALARTLGIESATIRSLDDLHSLRSMLMAPDGPVLLDCKINGAVAAPFTAE